jgi:hypothetical protein
LGQIEEEKRPVSIIWFGQQGKSSSNSKRTEIKVQPSKRNFQVDVIGSSNYKYLITERVFGDGT